MKRGFPFLSCKLSDEQVIEILQSTLSQREAAKIYDVSPGMINRIHRRESYAWVAPEMPRRFEPPPGPRCSECIHLGRDGCSLEIPEHRTLQERAATVCAAYAVETGLVF